ncbi:hypothetical protein ACSC9T_15150 [Pseudomonas putida]|uniref:hypothetical protein n=1 Tax=Pseudomonas putida TaxID=303 RepID=UPI003F4AB0B2
MSGAEDLARLTQTIDKTDELLLSPEIKMVEVSPGVFRPTNAMVMANLSTLLGGAMPYTSVALGLEGTTDGTNFSVLSTVQDEYVNVYRNVDGSAVFVDSYPSSDALKSMTQLVQSQSVVAPEIRAMQKSIADRADAKTLLAPLWALTNPDVGYSFSAAGAAGEDGFYAVDWSDPVHPWQASRIATFQALAPYIAAAALNLI